MNGSRMSRMSRRRTSIQSPPLTPIALAIRTVLQPRTIRTRSACAATLVVALSTSVHAAQTPAQLNLSDLDGRNGFVIQGAAVDDGSGYSVSNAGDINGDGTDDLLIGQRGSNHNGSATYVVFGGSGVGVNGTIDLATPLTGSNGFVIQGAPVLDQSGRSVSNAGDINGDGTDDLLIGARLADPNGSKSGATYVVFGGSGVGAGGTIDLATPLTGRNGFVIQGAVAGDYLGQSVSNAGDINGDGTDDLLIGAPYADPNGRNSGATYVVFGGSGVGTSGTIDLATPLTGSNGFVIQGAVASEHFGRSVSNAGDINGDGTDDLMIGVHRAGDPDGINAAATYVVFGGSGVGSGGTIDLTTPLTGSNGFVIQRAAVRVFSNFSVSNAGDINGDGTDDLLIGADLADPYGSNSGATYVVFGGSGVGTSGTIDLATPLTGSNGFVIQGAAAFDFSGFSVSNAGDINGDGTDDLLIGAPGADSNGMSSGATYVVYGGSGVGASGTIDLATPLTGSNGFVIQGAAVSDFSGRSVSNAGDINGDGTGDLLIGARGATYVVYMPLADTYEPNFPTAATSIALGETQSHNIAPVGDVDGFTFSVDGAGARVVIETFNDGTESGHNTVIELRDTDGTTVLDSDDDGGSGLYSRIERDLPAGDYFFNVKDYDDGLGITGPGDHVIPSYGIHVSVISGFDLEQATWYLISLPATPPAGQDTVGAIFGDELGTNIGSIASGNPNGDWLMYQRDEEADTYVELELGESLEPGKGYWIIQVQNATKTVHMPLGSTQSSLGSNSACALPEGCFERALTTTAGTNRWNLVGNPFYSSPSYDQLRVSTASGNCETGCTIEEAVIGGAGVWVNFNELWRWDPTAGAHVQLMSGDQLLAWGGIWDASLSGGVGNELKLLFPRF